MINYTPYIIPPLLSLITGYILAAISITRKNLTEENILLSMTCIWWTLLSWAFLWHNIESDTATIMRAERVVHTFYAYVPVVSLLFFQKITGYKNRVLLYGSLTFSTVIAIFVQTDLYFYDFYYYPWGMIAKGGPAFIIFSLYATIISLYIFYLFIKKIKTEKNRVVRLKINYMAFSYFISVLLTLTNIPAINGINFYPLSNLIFIPLGIMTYGIIRYRLINISSAVQYSLFWLILSSLIIIPNLFIFIQIKEIFSSLNTHMLILIFLLWFTINYFYFNRIQPVINRLINRKNFNLKNTEKNFLRDFTFLKNLDDLIYEVTLILKKNLELSHASLYLRELEAGYFSKQNGETINLNDSEIKRLTEYQDTYLQKSLMETKSETEPELSRILSIPEFERSEYLMPLVNQNVLIALIFLSEKTDKKQLNGNEFRFLKNISTYAGIALANSVMFQNLSDIKENLELMVEERTSVIEKQKSELEKDMQLAGKIQMSLLPANIPVIKKTKIAYKYEPVLGVGGDFIDIHYREGMNEIGLFICDVSGHGVSSAMIASMVKMSLHSWGRYIQKPAAAFAEMKRLLSGKIGDNFISAFMCCIDLNTGVVTSSCAGHPPMIILRENREVEIIKPEGRVIIEAAESVYKEIKTPLYPGDMIVLYTDGVIEARTTSGEMIGEDGFIAMLKKHSDSSPLSLCNRIYDEIFNNNSSTVMEDDFALLVAEYTG